MAKQNAVNVGDGAAQINTVNLVEGDKYFFGNVSTASDDFDAIMSTNSTYTDMVELFKEALAGNVEGVKVSELDCNGYTLEIVNDAGVVDTLRVNADVASLDTTWFGGNVGDNRSDFNVIDLSEGGKANKIIGTSKNYFDTTLGEKTGGIKDLVGGSAKGENDFKALLEAALDDGDHRVTLLDIDGDSFSIQVHRNDAVDTFLVKNAGDVIADVFGPSSLLDPNDSADQFLFVSADDFENSPGKKIAIGTDAVAANDETDIVGGSIKIGQLPGIVAAADEVANVEVSEIGDLTQIKITDNSTDVITIETDLLV